MSNIGNVTQCLEQVRISINGGGHTNVNNDPSSHTALLVKVHQRMA